jgi:hypothetical protein
MAPRALRGIFSERPADLHKQFPPAGVSQAPANEDNSQARDWSGEGENDGRHAAMALR